MSRLIDADAFIELIKQKCDPQSVLDPLVLSICRGAIKSMPTVEPMQWIPCSERLPEKNGGYLATEKFSNYFPPQINILYFAKNLYAIDKYDFATKRGEAGFYSRDDELGYIFTDGVIAWCELPEPYREESNEHQG